MLVCAPFDQHYLLDIASLGSSLHRCMNLCGFPKRSCHSPYFRSLAA